MAVETNKPGEVTGETFKVEERTRLVHDSRLVVLPAGTVIPLEQAAEYGLTKKPPAKKGDD